MKLVKFEYDNKNMNFNIISELEKEINIIFYNEDKRLMDLTFNKITTGKYAWSLQYDDKTISVIEEEFLQHRLRFLYQCKDKKTYFLDIL